MSKQKEHRVGIYVRLSNEDERAGESVSVENQKLLLTAHVKNQGWELVETYCDDGFSGTNQNRPALQRMLADVRQGYINTVVIKDLSRLGRNYLEVGNLQEVFLPEHGCELISLTEKMDEMAVFRNWMNEQHSRETSKKVKAVRKMCAQSGKFLGSYTPYGYQKSLDNKHKLIPDENTVPTVRRIFELRSQGLGFRAIAVRLNEEGVLPPRDYYYQQRGEVNPANVNHLWNENTLKVILRNEVYIGNTVQAKVGTVSYKNHKTVAKPKEEWIRAEGTHEPIIDRELWNLAQAIDRKHYRPRKKSDGTTSIFTGLVHCADCGFKMRNQNGRRTRKDGVEYRYSAFLCGNYARSGKAACSTHLINEEALKAVVIATIQKHARMVEHDEAGMVDAILAMRSSETTANRTAYQNEIKAHSDRLAMLNRLIEKLYEDRLTGTIPEAVFRSLMEKYEQERVSRRETVENLSARLANIRQDAEDVNAWADLIKRYSALEVLGTDVLLRLVDRIVVGEPHRENGIRVCDVQVIYNYVGGLEHLGLTVHEGGSERAVGVYEQAV